MHGKRLGDSSLGVMDLDRRRKLTMGFLVGVAAIGLGVLGVVRTVPILFSDGGTWHQKIHWMVYGYDRVWYHHRTYVYPSRPMSPTELERRYGHGATFAPTGQTVIGLPVYNTPRGLAFDRREHVVPTLLFLKKPGGKFVVYTLSGGP